MSGPTTIDAAVRRELLQLALRNAVRSVPALLVVLVLIGALGVLAGRSGQAFVAVVLGLASAGWRLGLTQERR